MNETPDCTQVVLQLQRQLNQERALHNVVAKIRQSLDLEQILKTTLTEVQQLLKVDRVGVLRLDPGMGWDEGTLIAESVLPAFDTLLAVRVQDHCFGQDHAEHYRNGKIQALDDVEAAGLSRCHLELLRQYQVRANLLVPLVIQENLWGLLCIHQCSGPRHWEVADIEFARQISEHLSVAIDHAELMNSSQQQTKELNQALACLKDAHIQLAQTEKMVGLAQLSSGMAHEINNPINFIHGNLDYLQQGLADIQRLMGLYRQHCDPTIAEIAIAADKVDLDFLLQDLPRVLQSMAKGTRRISRIVKALGDFSRLDNEGRKPTDLNHEIETTLLLLRHYFQPKGTAQVHLEKHYGEIPLVDCYPALINQVLMHLLRNAVDALTEGNVSAKTVPAKVTITTMATVDTVKIAIHDNGSGITDANQLQLFDPFFTTKPVGQGTGLGLAISYKIIVSHGGTLDCQSILDQGTTFTLELPIHSSLP